MLPRTWFPDRLTGEHVVLERHVAANLEAFQRWYADPEVARLTRYQEGPMRSDEIERFFLSRVVGPDSLALAIHLRTTGQLIGTCAFSQLDGDNGSALFHITIGEKEHWGMGYGTEATELMLEHAFVRLGLHRVALTVFSFNERAVRSYVKVGFVVEGRSREAIWRDGRYWDEISMSVLEEDWRARRLARGRPWSVEAATTGDRGGRIETPQSLVVDEDGERPGVAGRARDEHRSPWEQVREAIGGGLGVPRDGASPDRRRRDEDDELTTLGR